ncbi:hypothetical protein HMN09_00672400 [Mycena chlorophos]|uniref:AttH domain-containing protein n=1 Tax=Mycena chlorophos TaxID=658473 RepID=A0A8H6T2H3_MYCCL|nr:hypothetical protein HMN09_00672400 [Mycena chlorophos]
MASFRASIAVALLCCFSESVRAATHEHTYSVPAAVQSGPSASQLVYSSSLGLEAPKISSVSNTSFDWWYFDAVSSNPEDFSSVTVVFYTANSNSFPFLPTMDTVTPVQISGSFPNGTLWGGAEFVGASGASVSISAEGHSAKGVWHDTGFSWSASSASEYHISVDSATLGIKGTISFKAVAPSHLPCGKVENGTTMLLGGQIGWAISVSDSDSFVDLRIGDEQLKFQGLGYHDKNWANIPFTTHVQSWYWGHARVGPYSIVWFDMLDLNNTEHVSAYVSRGDEILVGSCNPGTIQVRPQPMAYPPTLSTPDPTGYQISIPSEKMQVTVGGLVPLIGANPEYVRFFGNLTAVVDGGKVYHGTGLMEQFKLTA